MAGLGKLKVHRTEDASTAQGVEMDGTATLPGADHGLVREPR